MTSETKAPETQAATAKNAATSPSYSITLRGAAPRGRRPASAGGARYPIPAQRLGTLASSAAVADLPAVLRVPLSEPLFLLGTLFILVVMFLPGGIAGAASRLAARRRPGEVREEARERLAEGA